MEEERVRQWLQHPLDDYDDLETSFYCSELFGSLPPPLPAPFAPNHGPACGLAACKKKKMANCQAETALAMGADRALGAVVPPGLNAFGKVRTSLVHVSPPPLALVQAFEGPSSSLNVRSNIVPLALPPSPLARLNTKLSPLIDSTSKEAPPEVSLSQCSSQKILKAVSTNVKRKPSCFPSSKDQSENAERESTASERVRTQSTSKRIRIAEVHNLSEQRRRKRINDKLRALQELIPNSNKTDKASMLDEAIEYLKLLQAQLQMMVMMSGTHVSPMMYNHGVAAMHVPHMNPMQLSMSVAGPGMGVFGMMDMMMPGTMAIPGHPLLSFYPTQKSYTAPVITPNMDSLVTSGAPHNTPSAIPHPGQFQISSTQGIQPVNMEAYNTYLQHQQCVWQQQELGQGQEQLSTLQEESTLVNDSFPNG